MKVSLGNEYGILIESERVCCCMHHLCSQLKMRAEDRNIKSITVCMSMNLGS